MALEVKGVIDLLACTVLCSPEQLWDGVCTLALLSICGGLLFSFVTSEKVVLLAGHVICLFPRLLNWEV